MRRTCLFGCVGTMALAACFGGSSSAPPSTASPDDGGSVSDATLDAGADVVSSAVGDAPAEAVATDAPADAAPPSDAPADAPPSDAGPIVDDAGIVLCPGDLSSAAYVTDTATAGPSPAFTGGTIPDGTYILSTYVEYDMGIATCSNPSDAAPRMVRGAITVSGGMVRLDVQAQGDVDQCFAGTIGSTFSTDAGSFVLIAESDGGPNFGFFYSVSPDGLTLTTALGGSSCASSDSDGATGSSTSVGVFVRP